MEVLDLDGWRFFVGDDSRLIEEKAGKWMYFFEDKEGRIFSEERCREAVEKEIVWEAKCSNSDEGVACFYLNMDDIERHKRIIEFFLDYDMIQRTKTGKLYNISFKLNDQTRAGLYWEDFKAELKLENLLDLNTGKWLV